MNSNAQPVKVEMPAWFDPEFYLATYPEVRESGINPWVHFLAHGYVEGRRTSASQPHPDAARSEAPAMPAPPAWFDQNFYLATYPEVRESGIDPWVHFLAHGYVEGRRTSASQPHPGTTQSEAPPIPAPPTWFDRKYYLTTYPEVRDSGVDPWAHFLAHGYVEGRRTSASQPHPDAGRSEAPPIPTQPAWFDQNYYLRTNPEVRESGIDPWRHFVEHGRLEGRQASGTSIHPEWFDPEYYLKSYPEVQDAGVEPWDHFLEFGYTEGRRPSHRPMAYDFDGLATHHNNSFMQDPAFVRAYNRGSQAARGIDHHWYWRFHVGLWCLRTAFRLPGDFVEFGVNYGMLASGGMLDLDWNQHDKHFYLFESFGGMKPEHVSSAKEGRSHLDSYNSLALSNGFYATDPEEVRANFAEFHNVHLIVGFVPDTLDQLAAREVAFVHVDMNNPVPEVLALRFVWDRIVTGGLVLLDDYAQKGFELQKRAMDDLSHEIGFDILSLPTGQGLIIKT